MFDQFHGTPLVDECRSSRALGTVMNQCRDPWSIGKVFANKNNPGVSGRRLKLDYDVSTTPKTKSGHLGGGLDRRLFAKG